MKNQNKIAGILFFIAAILFIASAIIGKSFYFIPIGCCYIVIGFVFIKKKPPNQYTQ